MKRYGQAALEFLSTYGFAFLLIVVMIAALSYFGILTPANLLPDRCSLGSTLGCVEQRIRNDGTDIFAEFIIQNNIGNPVTILTSQFNLTSDFSDSASCTSGIDGESYGPGDFQLPGGQRARVVCNMGAIAAWPGVGQKARVGIVGQYRPLGASFEQPIIGDMFATIQQG